MTSPSQGARDEILGKVRSALAGTEPTARPQIPRGSAPDDVVALFAERVADYRAVVERCTKRQLPARLKAALPEGRVVVPAGLSVTVPDAVVDDGLSAAELDACAAVVTDAAVGIAETGTIVLDHGSVDELEVAGITLAFAEMKGPVKDRLKAYGLYERLGDERFFPTIGTAVDGYVQTSGVGWVDWEERPSAT